MPFLSRNTEPLSYASFIEEAERCVIAGEVESFIYLVPNRVAQRRIERRLVEAARGKAIAKPNVLTLADLAGVLCSIAFPQVRLLSDAESAVLIEQSIRALIREDRLRYFERARDGASVGAHVGADGSSEYETFAFPIPRGTFELVVNTIRRLKQNGVLPHDISTDLERTRRAKGETTEVRRAADIFLIYDAYQASLRSAFTDSYGQFLWLNERYSGEGIIDISHDFRSAFPNVTDLFIEGFSHFELPAISLLSMASRVPGLRTVIRLDTREDNPNLFGGVLELQGRFAEQGFVSLCGPGFNPVELDRVETRSTRVQEHLARYLFATEIPEKLHTPNVHIHEAANFSEEVEEIARRVKLIFEADPEIRKDLSRIVVATPLAEAYTPLFQEVFRRHEIPVQFGDRYHLDRLPLVMGLIALFDIVRFGLHRREVVRALASPYFRFHLGTPNDRSSADDRTNPDDYLDAKNLLDVIQLYKPSGNLADWKHSLSAQLTRIHSKQDEAEDRVEFDRLANDERRIRRALSDIDHLSKILAPFERPLHPSEFCRNVRSLISRLEVGKQILEGNSITIGTGTLSLDARGYRALTKLIEDLESLFLLMGIEREALPLTFYIERLKAATIWTRYNAPALSGCVLVTSLEQSIGEQAEYLFVAGMTEGTLPSVYQPQVFLMDSRQRGERKQLLEERVLFYHAITNFRQELYLSYPKRQVSGGEVTRSIFLDELEEVVEIEKLPATKGIFSYRDLYLNVAALRLAKPGLLDELLNDPVRIPATSFYAETLREHVPRALHAQELRHQLKDSVYRGYVDPSLLTESERSALEYNQSRIWSVTQLELYASCPFRFFAKHALSLGESQEREDGLDARDRGSVLHEVLREFLTSRRERKLPALQDIPDEHLWDAYQDVRQIAERQLAEMGSDHPFWRLDAERLLSEKRPGDSKAGASVGASRTGVLWKFIERERSLTPYEPRPSFFEVSFGAEGSQTGKKSERDTELSQDAPVIAGGIRLRGKIDRIDKGDDTFTLIDYKSGKETNSYADIKRGLSLQLPLYLRAAEDLLRSHFPELKGVAALYHKVLAPDSERKLGLAVREYMSVSFEKLKGRGGLIDSEEELKELIEATIVKARSYVDGVASGKFPLIEKDLVGRKCPNCPYRSVCRVREAEDLDLLR